MSSLIYFADPDQALVVTDTLATQDNVPAFFTSKADYAPHLRLIVAGTGYAGFSGEWFHHVSCRMLVRGVEHLDHFATEWLQENWARWDRERGIPEGGTTTVYHFGVSEETGKMVVIAYRSANGFRSERIDNSQGITGAKPDCTIPEGNIIELIGGMMQEQRELQAEVPLEDRIHIGGEAIAMHLTAECFRAQTLFRFDDYDQQMQQAVRRMEAERV